MPMKNDEPSDIKELVISSYLKKRFDFENYKDGSFSCEVCKVIGRTPKYYKVNFKGNILYISDSYVIVKGLPRSETVSYSASPIGKYTKIKESSEELDKYYKSKRDGEFVTWTG